MSGSFTITPPASPATGRAAEEVTSDIYGEDILFTDDFQLTGDDDYVVTVDSETVRQAIYRRLLVRPGEFKLRPEYGCGVALYVKKKLTKSALDELRQRIVENLLQESRIAQVVEVVLEAVTSNNRPGLRVYVKVVIAGTQTPTTYPAFVFVDQ